MTRGRVVPRGSRWWVPMSWRQLVASLFALLVLSPAHAAPRPSVPQVAFEKHVLRNGLQLILHVNKKLPLVHVNLAYHVGSKNEQRGKSGFAHLFEHLMLQGSKNAPEDYFTLMARAGAKGGRDSNGTTNSDITSYWATAPSGSLEYLLWVQSDMLATLPEAIDQTKLDNQRDVVRNELRQSFENRPYGRLWQVLPGKLFPAGHPYSWPIVGTHRDLQAASLADVKAFFRTYYAPNNLSLVVAGDFDPANARRLVEKYFGSMPPGPALTRPGVDIPQLDAEKVIEIEDRVSLERVFFAWPTPQIGGADEPELTLAASILAEGLSSRLQKALIYDRKLCTEVSASYETAEIASTFILDATLRPGASMPEVERIVSAEIASLAQTGPTAAELQRARTRLATGVTSKLQSIGASGVPMFLNYYNVYYGDPGKLSWDLERTLAASPQSVRAAVGKWLATPKRLVLRFRPVTSAQAEQPEPDRSKPPALGEDVPFRVPSVATSKLANGLELFVVERHELPLVSAALLSRAGSVLDPSGKEGLAKLVASAMRRGTRARSALAIEAGLGDLGSSLATNVELEYAAHALEVQKENVPAALDLVADVARNPVFPTAELERERKLQLDELNAVEDDATLLGRRLRWLFSFGPAHPYGRPVLGHRATIGSLTATDAAAFHAASWRPDNCALVLIGDVTLTEAEKLAQKAFGSWQGAAAAPPQVPAPQPLARGKIAIVDKPGAEQTVAVQLFAAPREKNDEYYALRLASEVLGTGTTGRLYGNLRQQKGYSYRVGSYLRALAGGMAWYADGAVQTDKTSESVVEFVREQRGLAGARPIDARELEHARLGLLRNYAAGFDTNLDVMQRIRELWSRRWPIEELTREQAGLQRATLAQVQAAANRYVVPTEASFLLIGDRNRIEPKLRSLKLTDVIAVDLEGRPLAGAAKP